MAPIKSFGERIAEALVEDGLLSVAEVQELLEQQKRDGTRFVKLVAEKGKITDLDMVVSMGRVLNTPPINVARASIPIEIVDLLPRDIAVNYKVLPISRLGNKLFLAMADPLNVLALDDVKRLTKLEVSPMIASARSRISGGVGGMSASPSVRAMKYRPVPPTKMGVLFIARACSSATAASSRQRPTE